MNLRAGKLLAHVQRDEGALEKYFKRWFEAHKCNITKVQKKIPELKQKISILFILLTSSQLHHSINIAIRMSPIQALPELQLDGMPGDSPIQ